MRQLVNINVICSTSALCAMTTHKKQCFACKFCRRTRHQGAASSPALLKEPPIEEVLIVYVLAAAEEEGHSLLSVLSARTLINSNDNKVIKLSSV